MSDRTDRRATALAAADTVIIVATERVRLDDLHRSIGGWVSRGIPVVVALAEGHLREFHPPDSVRVVRNRTTGAAIRAAAALAAASHCLVVDASQSAQALSDVPVPSESSSAIVLLQHDSPLGNRLPPCPAVAALVRRRAMVVPSAALADGRVALHFDDVVATYESLVRFASNGGVIVNGGTRPDGEKAGWKIQDAIDFGSESVDLARIAPHTAAAGDLAAFRSVSYGTHLRRRLVLSSGRGVTTPALGFWYGVRRRARREEWSSLTAATTILMYHAFSDARSGSRYVVTRRSLRRQLRLLRWTRRRLISLDDYISTRRSGGVAPARSVIVTIDDGYADVLSVAVPEFERQQMAATLFVPTGHVGGVCDWSTDPALSGRPLATWDQLRARPETLLVGSHARHHVAFDQLDDEAIDGELVGSVRDLKQHLDLRAEAFAYPYGADSSASRLRLERSDFTAACTSHGGRNAPFEPLHSLRRVEIRGDASAWRFLVALFTGSALPLRRQIGLRP